ncbi:MAG: hypothetical protein ACI9YH_000309, partial [Colwellia sp.]
MKMIELNDGRANAIIAPSLGGSVLAYNV